MKFINKTLILFSVIALLNVPNAFSRDTEEIGEKFDKSQRFEWINNSRGGNDGINWQLIDNETRLSKYDLLLRDAKNKQSNSLQGDFIANGKIEGRWVEKGSNNNSGRIRGVDLDLENELIYAISDGGNIFRGSLEGENWTCLNNSIRFDNPHLIKVLKFNGKKRILAVTYGGRLSMYSDDEGQTWNSSQGLDNPRYWGGVRRCVVANDANQTIYLLGNEWDYSTEWKDKVVIYYSKNHGETFERILFEEGNLALMDLWADRYDTDKVFYFKNDSIFNLNNGTIKFRKTYDLNLVSSPIEITASGANDNGIISFILCVRQEPNKQNFIVSNNQGATWKYSGSLDQGKFMMPSFSTSTYSIDFAYFGSVDLHMSNDAGASWSIRNDWRKYYQNTGTMLHADVPAVQFFRTPDNSELMFISTDGGLFKSDDYGSNVKNISLKGLNVSQYYSVLTAGIDTNIIYAGAQDQGFQRTNSDSGQTLGFKQLFSGDYGSISSSDNGNSLWSVYPNFVLYMRNAPVFNTTMGFKTWDFEGLGWHWMTPTRAVHGQPNVAYAIGGDNLDGSYLWRFSTVGSNDVTAFKLPRNFRIDPLYEKLIALEISKSNIFYCSSDQGIMHITHDGEAWDDYPIYEGEQRFYPSYIAIDPSNENIVYVGGRGYNTPGVFASLDGGKTYQAIIDGLPNTYINGLAVSSDGKLVFAATSTGPYVFVTWMKRWYSMATLNSPDQDFRWVEYVPSSKTVRFATYGRGIWDFKIENIFTGIEENEKPINFTLNAYPNPMNENSTIQFNLPVSGDGTVKIFDINGHEIIKLHDGFLQAGNNSFNWNGLNSAGFSMNNGTYLCLVSISGFTAYTKIEMNK